MRHTDSVAEVQNTIRRSCAVVLTDIDASEAVYFGMQLTAYGRGRYRALLANNAAARTKCAHHRAYPPETT